MHLHLGEQRPEPDERSGAALTWPEDPAALPALDSRGALVLPLNCPLKYRWWAGGQSVEQTLKELAHAP